MFDKVDKNGDGCISFEELSSYVDTLKPEGGQTFYGFALLFDGGEQRLDDEVHVGFLGYKH